MKPMVHIDGSHGEGGGQMLRTAVSLSLVTGRPFRIEKIRAGRPRPGLMRQHLTAVNAAVAVGRAQVEGAAVGSGTLTFTPGQVEPGAYHFVVGTAGSATLVLQTVLPALVTASGPSSLTLEGGTHNPFAPPFDFLDKAFLPLVNRMGPRVTATLERRGFYPAGGGKIVVQIEPVARLQPIELLERGAALTRSARAIVAHLPRHIAERELRVIGKAFNWDAAQLHVEEDRTSPGPGNVVMAEVQHEHVTEVFIGFGESMRAAEAVAQDVVDQYKRYLISTAPVGEYLTDQLLLPMALAGEGQIVSAGLSRHATTLVDLIQRFLDRGFDVKPREQGAAQITIRS